jgi:hypothetical protein
LSEQSFEAEQELSRKFDEAGVLLVSGEMMRSTQPGWFRIVFTGLRNDFDEGD